MLHIWVSDCAFGSSREEKETQQICAWKSGLSEGATCCYFKPLNNVTLMLLNFCSSCASELAVCCKSSLWSFNLLRDLSSLIPCSMRFQQRLHLLCFCTVSCFSGRTDLWESSCITHLSQSGNVRKVCAVRLSITSTKGRYANFFSLPAASFPFPDLELARLSSQFSSLEVNLYQKV